MRAGMQPDARFENFRHACLEFTALVPPDALLVVRGGSKFDGHGHPVAYNDSLPFAWMDRKGWNYAIEDLSPGKLQALADAGARFWLAQPEDLEDRGFRGEVERKFTRVASSGRYELFQLSER
jgi:hypothetical protein